MRHREGATYFSMLALLQFIFFSFSLTSSLSGDLPHFFASLFSLKEKKKTVKELEAWNAGATAAAAAAVEKHSSDFTYHHSMQLKYVPYRT